jgi:hypothetical protein
MGARAEYRMCARNSRRDYVFYTSTRIGALHHAQNWTTFAVRPSMISNKLDDLEMLKRAIKRTSRERRLVCAECRGEIVLRDYLYGCVKCNQKYAKLMELQLQ